MMKCRAPCQVLLVSCIYCYLNFVPLLPINAISNQKIEIGCFFPVRALVMFFLVEWQEICVVIKANYSTSMLS